MDTTLWIIVAVVIAIVAYRYPQAIGLDFKGWGARAKLRAKGRGKAAAAQSGSRNASIGGNATDNRIVTGDDAPGKKPPTTAARRNLSTGSRPAATPIVVAAN